MSIMEPVVLSLKLAFLTTLILLLFGLPFSWWLARWQHPAKSIVLAIVALPLVLPPTVLGFYLLMAFSPDSFAGEMWMGMTGSQLAFSFEGILLGSLVYSLPFAIQPLTSGFSQIQPIYLDVAKTMGLSGVKRFIKLVLPMAKNSIAVAAGLTFAHTIGEFGVVLMIGGNLPGETQVVSIALFDMVETMAYDQAHTLAFGLLIFSILMLTGIYRLNRSKDGLWS